MSSKCVFHCESNSEYIALRWWQKNKNKTSKMVDDCVWFICMLFWEAHCWF